MNKKKIAVLMAVMLMIGVASGATLAWLKASSSPVHNVFTVGDIGITLNETKGDQKIENGEKVNYFHFVPGDELDKDPTVTVDATSEDCYLFVKVDVTNNSCKDTTVTPNVTADPIFSWTFDSKWGGKVYVCTKVEGTNYYTLTEYEGDFTDNGTYYLWYDWKNVEGAITEFGILADNKIMLSSNVTKGMVNTINTPATQPSVTFEAAAVQSQNLAVDKDGVTAMMRIMEQLPGDFKVVNTPATN